MDNPDVCARSVRRRLIMDAAPRVNGIDYIEVQPDRRTLKVYLLNKAVTPDGKPLGIDARQVVIEGGVRVRRVHVVRVDSMHDDFLEMAVDGPGDSSPYVLRLVSLDKWGQPAGPLDGFDPRLAHAPFTFDVGGAVDMDCPAPEPCPPPAYPRPDISYLAKDYASFKQLVFDRLALIAPDWTERHAPDLGVALVELMAYVGDHLSYYQDAVATEAYLETARRRVSVRRHARLVDYAMHEGCNARAWVCVETNAAIELNGSSFFFAAGLGRAPHDSGLISADAFAALRRRAELFEPMGHGPDRGVHRWIPERNAIDFYTWGEGGCCLPTGATRAALTDAWTAREAPSPGPEYPRSSEDSAAYYPPWHGAPKTPLPRALQSLRAGDVLVFEERIGPQTGQEADADPARRCAVRLTRVTFTEDKAVRSRTDPDRTQPVVEIEWSEDDALPFPLCLSSVGRDCQPLERVSIARGNVVLVDHGRTIVDEEIGAVEGTAHRRACECVGRPGEVVIDASPFRPRLLEQPLTFAAPLASDFPVSDDPAGPPDPGSGHPFTPASALTPVASSPRAAAPAVALRSIPSAPWEARPLVTRSDLTDGASIARRVAHPADARSAYIATLLDPETVGRLRAHREGDPFPHDLSTAVAAQLTTRWTSMPDLLGSAADAPHFVVEMEDDGIAHLRFGDGELGRAPQAGSMFLATYRVGVPTAGNVGPETITHMVTEQIVSGASVRVRNPLAAVGGTAPEPTADVKQLAPHAFRTELVRAVATEDYARLAERHPRVERAAAELRWAGARWRVTVAIDQKGRSEPDDRVLEEVARLLSRYRRIGHDVEVTGARHAPLHVELEVVVRPEYLQGHVRTALVDVFSNRALPDGRRGVFHPDNFSFGDGVYVSRLVAAAHATAGVESVEVTMLRRQFEQDRGELEAGALTVGPLEIARLDNAPRSPEHGRLVLHMRGGR